MKINPPSRKAMEKSCDLSKAEADILLRRGLLRFRREAAYAALSKLEQVALQLEYEAEAADSWKKAIQSLRKRDAGKKK